MPAQPCPRRLRFGGAGSLPQYLVELNAPPEVVLESLRICAGEAPLREDRLGLLAQCVTLAMTHSNAFGTLSTLLLAGLDPNVIVADGDTLLQYALRLDRVREVEELLRFSVDPHGRSCFGPESCSNLEAAYASTRQAGAVARAHFANQEIV